MSNAFPNTIKKEGTHPMLDRYLPDFFETIEKKAIITKRIDKLTPSELVGRHLTSGQIIFPGSVLQATNIKDGIKPKQTTSVYSDIEITDVSLSLAIDNFEMMNYENSSSIIQKHAIKAGNDFITQEEFMTIRQVKRKGIKSLQTATVTSDNAYETVLKEIPRFEEMFNDLDNVTFYISNKFKEILQLDSKFSANVNSSYVYQKVFEKGQITEIGGVKIVKLPQLNMHNLLYIICENSLITSGNSAYDFENPTFPNVTSAPSIHLIKRDQTQYLGGWAVVGRAQIGATLKTATAAVYREVT